MFSKPLRNVALLAFAVVGPVSAASASPLPPIWQGVSRVAILCLVQPTMKDNRALQSAICERVRLLASKNSPAPVTVIAQGDPAVLAAGTLTLLVHASIRPAGPSRLVAFTVRPFRVSADQNSVLFGAAPRAATIPASGAGSPVLAAALSAALSETVPWLAKRPSPRPIADRN